MQFPMDRKVLNEGAVTIEYSIFSGREKRVRREFTSAFAARHFYIRADREGRQPKVVAKQGA